MRRLLIALLVALAALAGGSLLAWNWATGQMATQLAAWEAAQRAQGWAIAHGAPERGGWPFAAELSLPEFSLAGGGLLAPGGLSWRAARVMLHVGVAQPRLARIAVGGAQELRLGPNAPLRFEAARCELSAPVDIGAGAPQALALDASGVRFAAGGGIGLLQAQADLHDPAAVAFRLTAEAIAFPPPPAPQPALGGHIASASLDGVWRGGWPVAEDPAASAAAWRAAGGEVAVTRLAVGWGPLGVSGGGTATLDDRLQPAGSARLRLVGYDAALGALADGHALAPRAAQAAQAVMALLARAPDGGGAPVVEAPLTLSEGTLSMGRIPLARVPQFAWPSGPAAATLPK